jgi:hypothetical protein
LRVAFSRRQRATVWICLAVMAGMLLYPPWFWDHEHGNRSSRQYGAGHDWLWCPPPAPSDAPPEDHWHPVILWERLVLAWFTVGIGMVLLLARTSHQVFARRC